MGIETDRGCKSDDDDDDLTANAFGRSDLCSSVFRGSIYNYAFQTLLQTIPTHQH